MNDKTDGFEFKSLEIVKLKDYKKVSIRKILLIILGLFILFLVLPWQQTIIGHGKVTVFSPMDRPQKIHSQIEGRIKKWHVNEGQYVKKGDTLLEIEEINSNFLDEKQLERLVNKKGALSQKKSAINQSIQALIKQIESLSLLPENVKQGQELVINQQNDTLIAAKKALETAKFNLNRINELFKDGLRSKRDLELAQLKIAEKQAEVDIAQRNFDRSYFTRDQLVAETDINIQAAKSDLANAKEKLATVESDIIRLDIEISNLESRKAQRTIVSPIDGQITRLYAIGRLETVKSNQSLAVIVPQVVDQAVELYIDDYNAPLMRKGRHVRLMFSGWPAVQFSGWPFLSVGTFGGTIAAVDAVDDGRNRFRIIIRPDKQRIKDKLDAPWPEYPLLRPGTQAHGWILLDVVTIAFEIWRQFNGFPPSFPPEDKQNNY